MAKLGSQSEHLPPHRTAFLPWGTCWKNLLPFPRALSRTISHPSHPAERRAKKLPEADNRMTTCLNHVWPSNLKLVYILSMNEFVNEIFVEVELALALALNEWTHAVPLCGHHLTDTHRQYTTFSYWSACKPLPPYGWTLMRMYSSQTLHHYATSFCQVEE